MTRPMSDLPLLQVPSGAVKEQRLKAMCANAGKNMLLMGVHSSAFRSFSTHREDPLASMYEVYSIIFQYAIGEDVCEEINGIGRHLLLEKRAILKIIQQADLDKRNMHRHEERTVDNPVTVKQSILRKFPMHDAEYFMKFATAAYGDVGIQPAQIENMEAFD
jgi:hypothetical protein